MVHRDINRIGRSLIDKREAAIATLGAGPISRSRLLGFSAVVLSAADRKVSIRRMDRDALKLNASQGCVVFIYPGGAGRGVLTLPDAAVIGEPDSRGRGKRVNEDGRSQSVQAVIASG